MPVAPTYPGVYIEEIPSGVQTLVGVATSITAFIGYTARGPVNEGVRIFSYEDFEREFGGLSIDSPLSYGVRQFFMNGGGDAYIVRVAAGAQRAGVVLRNGTGAAATVVSVLRITAKTEGGWGNDLRIDVDYATENPASYFNLGVTQLVNRDGQLVVDRTERFTNLSMNSFDAKYAEREINARSELVDAQRMTGLTFNARGVSESGVLTLADLDALTDPARETNRLAVSVSGQPAVEFDLFTPGTSFTGTLPTRLAAIALLIEQRINVALGGTVVDSSVQNANAIRIRTVGTGERMSVRFLGTNRNAAPVLKLGAANGGTETEAAAGLRPAQSGTVGDVLPATLALLDDASTGVNVVRGTTVLNAAPVVLPLWGAPTGGLVTKPTTPLEVVERLQQALARSTDASISGARVSFINNRIRVVPGPTDPNVHLEFVNVGADNTADTLNLLAADADENVGWYAPGTGTTQLGQTGAVIGNNGAAPTATELRGSPAAKTGIYALEDVDLFNILCLPSVSDLTVLSEALAYCERRRAFMIVNLPETVDTLPEAQQWLTNNAALRRRNVATYFPQIRAADPLLGVVHGFDASGAIAGVYARTDAERGVWKAPAGTMATIAGISGVSVPLTDMQNGVLNQLGLNSLRNFNVYGNLVWGARTMRGADQLTDEYKYIPIRRLALFLEESLYRGTQWVVFEPNDEPLWAQIRLNVGAFMHSLYAQGAFQGQTPRDAYFVKCDGDTTTQNDRNLGRVNIVVGFAPLKPAEFVIIRIQQIAGNIQT